MTDFSNFPVQSPEKKYQKMRSRPTIEFMLSHPAHSIALGFGSGLSRFAPGTVGTLWAWLIFIGFSARITPFGMACVIVFALVIGWWACTVTANHLKLQDPTSIVWDEIVAFWLVLYLIEPYSSQSTHLAYSDYLTQSHHWKTQLAAFLLFRFFDAVKPNPVRWADRLFHGFGAKGGFGILFDDLVAAFCTLFVLACWRFWLG